MQIYHFCCPGNSCLSLSVPRTSSQGIAWPSPGPGRRLASPSMVLRRAPSFSWATVVGSLLPKQHHFFLAHGVSSFSLPLAGVCVLGKSPWTR